MTSKRTLLRRERRLTFDAETLALFVKLERMPRRRSDRSKEERELHRRLGLESEWFCSVVSVLDRARSHHSPGSPQADDWRRCYKVRLQLLAAAAEQGILPAGARP
jgi:hypothetical protein